MGAVTTHKFVSAVSDGGDATLVRPSNWNDEHSITDLSGTVEVTDAEWVQLTRISLASVDRMTLIGTARTVLSGSTDGSVVNIVGFAFRPTTAFRIPSGFAHRWMGRLLMYDPARAIVEGDGEMKLFDDLGSSRLVMTGRG